MQRQTRQRKGLEGDGWTFSTDGGERESAIERGSWCGGEGCAAGGGELEVAREMEEGREGGGVATGASPARRSSNRWESGTGVGRDRAKARLALAREPNSQG